MPQGQPPGGATCVITEPHTQESPTLGLTAFSPSWNSQFLNKRPLILILQQAPQILKLVQHIAPGSLTASSRIFEHTERQKQSSNWILFSESSQAVFLLLSKHPRETRKHVNAILGCSLHLSKLNTHKILIYTKGKQHFQSFCSFSLRFGLPIHDHHDHIRLHQHHHHSGCWTWRWHQ